jgi:hypothetical protein
MAMDRTHWFEVPGWLAEPARAVLADIYADDPIPGLRLQAAEAEGLDGLVLGVFEPDGSGGGRFVSRSLDPIDLLLEVAEIVQDECTETTAGWGQPRPRCPHHPHPARPSARDGEAWWICTRRDERLYRIGRGGLTAPKADRA